MRIINRALLYGRTITNLKLVQIRGQINRKIQGQKRIKKYELKNRVKKIRIAIPELDEDEKYLGRFDMEALLNDEVELLHKRHKLDKNWQEKEESHLWNYNLHYLEFTVPLAVKWKQTGDQKYKDKWIEYIKYWLDNGSENPDALESYTISLRIVNILIGLELIGEVEKGFKKKVLESVYNQYKMLAENTEIALLANHYFENLKALLIGSVMFGESEHYRRHWARFLRQVDEQILSDGLHYERSLMYHKIVLEDVLRVYQMLQWARRKLDAEKLKMAIQSMAEALRDLEAGFLNIPLFNDCGDNVSKSTDALLNACDRILGVPGKEIIPKADFPDSGYYRFDNGNISVLFDCGAIGPGYMGGHGHNDCLSFELAVNGKKVFTNSGTGQYHGALRSFFRGTSAHNTIMVDNHEQNELWGEHRVARRAGDFKVHRSENSLKGRFRSYTGDEYIRELRWTGKKLAIMDSVQSSGGHIARQYLHLVPGLKYKCDEDLVRVMDGEKSVATVKIGKKSIYLIHTEGEITNFASDFGEYEKKQVLEIQTSFKNKGRFKLEIDIDG